MNKIAYISTLIVPSGQASVNRLLSLSKGLVENDDEVHVLSSNINPTFDDGQEIDGIKIFNLGKKKGVSGLFMSLIRIIRKIKKEKYNAVISTSNNLLLIISLALICGITKTKFLQEKSEFPFSLMKKGILHKVYGTLYVNFTYKLMDGIIVMTNTLLNYYKPKARKKCQFITIPMTVDPLRFNCKKNPSEYSPYIAYCGNMSGNKDGVENLIESFKIVESECPDLKLVLIGGTNSQKELEKLKRKVSDLKLNNVIFHGMATRDEIPVLLKNADILALARPSSLQSTGGFPTKLGEYLSTGNPVVVTAVGEIPQYLNSSNSYIVDPDDIQSFANALIKAHREKESALSIGLKGKRVAEDIFDYKVQSGRLQEFISNLQ